MLPWEGQTAERPTGHKRYLAADGLHSVQPVQRLLGVPQVLLQLRMQDPHGEGHHGACKKGRAGLAACWDSEHHPAERTAALHFSSSSQQSQLRVWMLVCSEKLHVGDLDSHQETGGCLRFPQLCLSCKNHTHTHETAGPSAPIQDSTEHAAVPEYLSGTASSPRQLLTLGFPGDPERRTCQQIRAWGTQDRGRA